MLPVLTVPLHVIKNCKGDKWYMNLNNYRNTHYHQLNTYKVNYGEAIASEVDKLPVMERCAVRYTIFLPTKRRTDVSNVCTVVDKFLMDVVVKAGKLADDDYLHLPLITYKFGGIDRANPRAEVRFRSLPCLTQ